jgi:hypothetical protein
MEFVMDGDTCVCTDDEICMVASQTLLNVSIHVDRSLSAARYARRTVVHCRGHGNRSFLLPPSDHLQSIPSHHTPLHCIFTHHVSFIQTPFLTDIHSKNWLATLANIPRYRSDRHHYHTSTGPTPRSSPHYTIWRHEIPGINTLIHDQYDPILP